MQEERMKTFVLILALGISSWASQASAQSLPASQAAQQRSQPSAAGIQRITREVRHELLMLPYMDVFDYMAFKVDGYDVTLLGQVTRPSLKSDAERAVK